MAKKNIELIRQALAAAESSIKLAKQLLNDLEKEAPVTKEKVVDDTPGIVGVFDGESMVSADNQTFPVPSNYASKSMLVVGDTLKLIDEGKEKRFKQIEHVKRHKTVGVLAKKDGKWKVVAPEGSYKVLPAAVTHFGADVGDEVVLHLPVNNLTVSYGAIESVKKEKQMEAVSQVAEEVKEPPKKEEKVEKPVEKIEKKEEPKKAVKEPAKEVKTEPQIAKPVVEIEQPKVETPVTPTQVSAPKVEDVPAPAASVPASGDEELT